MDQDLRARLTPADDRKFGLLVGGMLVVLGGVSRWRGAALAPWFLMAAGGILLAGGLAVPRALRPIHRGWLAFGALLSKVTTPIFMGLIYFVVLTPMGLIRRVFGGPLAVKPGPAGYWVPRPDEHRQRRDMERQF